MTGSEPASGAPVSAREAEVLALLAEHLTYGEIGSRLFISARTVETHVESLRRKLGAADRRELARLAGQYREAGPSASLPAPLSSFVGRSREVAELTAALTASRLVSAVGPGGVGKTRLALRVAEATVDDHPGGTWYVDLVPVVDPAAVAAAVASAIGCTARAARSVEDALVAHVGEAPTLLVLDNCEHVVDAVARLVERLLAACAGLRVLVTSRARLVVPHEHAYVVPGLSLPGPDGDVTAAGSDAVALFVERAGRSGDEDRVARICAAVGGIALAIELAAARVPSLGLTGVESALSDQLGLLTGGARASSRHRSLQETLEWSRRLLDPADQVVLRRLSVFAAPFDTAAATQVLAFAPVDAAAVAQALPRLCDQSLLSLEETRAGSRLRALESVRQLGSRLMSPDESATLHRRHLGWTRAVLDRLDADDPGPASWTEAADAVADDARAALEWATTTAVDADQSSALADVLGHVLFSRGRHRDAQQVAERAAALAPEPSMRARDLERAAAYAKCRVAGVDALRLELAAAQAYQDAGRPGDAAVALARAAEHATRFVGMYAEPVAPQDVASILDRARELVGEDEFAGAAVEVAASWAGGGPGHVLDRAVPAALATSRREHTPREVVLLSAGLDGLCSAQLGRGRIVAAYEVARGRIDALLPHVADPLVAFELKDALHMACYFALGAGDLRASRDYAEQSMSLPMNREDRDLAVDDMLAPAALAGDWAAVQAMARTWRRDWDRTGRPVAAGRAFAPASVAFACGVLGDDEERAWWLAVERHMRGLESRLDTGEAPTLWLADDDRNGYDAVFDAVVLLGQDRPGDAFAVLRSRPRTDFYDLLLAPWQTSLLAEAAVLQGRKDGARLAARAAAATDGNPVASALAARAHALLASDADALRRVAGRFADLGCPYQQARTEELAAA